MKAHLFKITLSNRIIFCLLAFRMIAAIYFDNQSSMP